MKSIQQKAQDYAIDFFISLHPENLDYDNILEQLSKLDDWQYHDDAIIVWQPFENETPTWVADQIEIMALQLTELFSESVK